MRYITCVPSYGRDYKSAREVKAGWAAGHDFTIVDLFSGDDGRKVNKDDCPRGVTLNVRYKKLQNICVIKV